MAKQPTVPNSWEETPPEQPPVPQTAPNPVQAPAAPPRPSSALPQVFTVKDEDIDLMSRFVSNLTPAQLAVFKQKAAKVAPELAKPSLAGGIEKLPNGGLRAMIEFDVDVANQLCNWNENSGETLLETVQRFTREALDAWMGAYASASNIQPLAPAPVQAAPAVVNTPPPAAK